MKIRSVTAREILDSRGVPTVTCTMELENGACVTADVPSGVSTGKYEALELRDGDMKRYLGKGVLCAVANINTIIAPKIVGQEPHYPTIDRLLLDLDGTDNKSHLGANAILAVSIATVKAEAHAKGKEPFELIADHCKPKELVIPRVMFNVLNGGVHADNNLCFQEFSLISMKPKSFSAVLEMVFLLYNNLKILLRDAGHTTAVGDEGGFAPSFDAAMPEIVALDMLTESIKRAGFENDDVMICLDVAASQLYDEAKGLYIIHGKTYGTDNLIDLYDELVEKYPIFSLEDGIYEENFRGWEVMTERLGSQVQLIGDDVFVTNPNRIKKGIDRGFANAVLIKPNQIGTISETLAAMKLCQEHGYQTVVSHRSGETVDSFIADLVVGSHGGQFKAGACVRGERVAKYNRLLCIEEML